MTARFDKSLALLASLELVTKESSTVNGHTEPVLYIRRRRVNKSR
jgi:hypothetical protein